MSLPRTGQSSVVFSPKNKKRDETRTRDPGRWTMDDAGKREKEKGKLRIASSSDIHHPSHRFGDHGEIFLSPRVAISASVPSVDVGNTSFYKIAEK